MVPAAPPPSAPSSETAALDTVPIDLTEDGLPKRVRRSAAEPPPIDEPDEAPSMRSPEQTRAMMSAFQSAVTRGRRDADSIDSTAAEPEQEN